MKSPRMKFLIFIAAAALVTLGWIMVGPEEEEVPYLSIAELYENQGTLDQNRCRLGGLVKPGSISYSADRLNVTFVMAQGNEFLTVRYSGLTPDLFNDSAEVIIEGEFHDGAFTADNLMTKCASRYELD